MDTTSAVTNDGDLFVSQMKRLYVMYVAGKRLTPGKPSCYYSWTDLLLI